MTATDALLTFAVEAATSAGDLLVERFQRSASGVGTKSTPTDLVSDADRASEELLRDLISAAHPDDGILGEEGGGRPSRSGRTWVIDPLDATVNFLYGIPWWAVSVGVSDRDGDLIGVVRVPPVDETFAATRAGGATLNGKPIRVSTREDLPRALIATGFAYDSDARAEQAKMAARLLPTVRDIRRMGSAAIDLCSVAAGRVDGFFEAHLEEWDKAAGRLIVKEAGGLLAEIGPPVPGLTPGLVAAGPDLFEDLKEALSDEDR